jgi:GAF domain-containing protein
LQREQQNTETLLRILTEVSSSLDLDRALNRTLSLLNEAIGAEQGTIMLLHAEDNLCITVQAMAIFQTATIPVDVASP